MESCRCTLQRERQRQASHAEGASHHRGESSTLPAKLKRFTTPPWDSEYDQYEAHGRADNGSKPFQSTYYDARMRASPALLRARAPYLLKNTITGFAICSLVIGICRPLTDLGPDLYSYDPDTYTINAISQDEFEDVIVPDAPVVPSQQPAGTTAAVQQAVAARK